MKSRFLKICAITIAAVSVQAIDASKDLDHLMRSSDVWNDSAADFMLAFTPLGFGYQSQQRDVARSVNKELAFNGQRVWEAQVYFETGAVKRGELSLYNRGDSGGLDEAGFQQLCAATSAGLTRWAGNAGSSLDETTKDRANCVTVKHTWIKPPCAAQLSKTYTEPRRQNGSNLLFRAESVKITLLRTKGEEVEKDSTTVDWMAGASTMSIKKNVRKTDSGDVWVAGIPMVNQGPKGYCVVSASERLLRYYGRAMDEHQLAQLADTGNKGGTSIDGMVKALETLCQKFSLDLKPLIRLDWQHLSHLIEDYNRLAKTANKPVVEIGHSINISQAYATMDASTLRKSRAKEAGDFAQFRKDVKNYTSDGVPVLWACMIGKFPEVPPLHPGTFGGHMRLIIGYNEKTDELIYTDTWGPGHEFKRMPFEDAWAVTTSLHVLKPR